MPKQRSAILSSSLGGTVPHPKGPPASQGSRGLRQGRTWCGQHRADRLRPPGSPHPNGSSGRQHSRGSRPVKVRRPPPANRPQTTTRAGRPEKMFFSSPPSERSSTPSRGQLNNDPSAGSPTETLLRLLLPLNAQVWESSQTALSAEADRGPVQIPH